MESGRCSTLDKILVFRTDGLGPTLAHHQKPVDSGNGAGPMSDDDDNALAFTYAENGLRQRFLALGIEI